MTNPNRIRILYAGMVPPAVGGQEAGGIATHVWELATEARKRGYDVYILANTMSSFIRDDIHVIGPLRENKLLKGIHLFRQYLRANKECIGFLRLLNYKEKLSVFFQGHYLRHIIESVKPDVIHSHSFLNRAPLSLSLLRHCPPIIVTDHGIGVTYEYGLQDLFGIRDTSLFVERVRAIAEIADYIITDSEFAKALLIKNIGLHNTANIKAIPIPSDIDKVPFLSKAETKREQNLEDKKVIMFTGASHAVERKGLDILLEAFAGSDYLRRKCRLLIVTDGKTMSFAQEYARENDIDALISGPQPWENLVKYYNAADVFVMPSRKEAFGLVYTEALSAGTPVVGFDRSINELESLFGIYVGEAFDAWNENEAMLAEKIIKVLNTEFDRELLRRKAKENLSWDVGFEKFDAVYRQVAG